MIVPVLSRDDILKIESHFLQLIGECLQTIDLVMHLLAQLPLTSILNVPQQVLHADLLSFGCPNSGRCVHELPINISIIVGFLLREVGFSR